MTRLCCFACVPSVSLWWGVCVYVGGGMRVSGVEVYHTKRTAHVTEHRKNTKYSTVLTAKITSHSGGSNSQDHRNLMTARPMAVVHFIQPRIPHSTSPFLYFQHLLFQNPIQAIEGMGARLQLFCNSPNHQDYIKTFHSQPLTNGIINHIPL